jgi:hypothetical protein
MLAIAETRDAIAMWDISGRPPLSAAAGAKSHEGPSQERPRAALTREAGNTGTTNLSGELETTANNRRDQRAGMLSRSWLRFVLITALNIATGPAHVNSPHVQVVPQFEILPHLPIGRERPYWSHGFLDLHHHHDF